MSLQDNALAVSSSAQRKHQIDMPTINLSPALNDLAEGTSLDKPVLKSPQKYGHEWTLNLLQGAGG